MRTNETMIIQQNIITITCDFCDKQSKIVEGQQSMNTGMWVCDLCESDCCHKHHYAFQEHIDGYPDLVVCLKCLERGKKIWKIAQHIAKRYDIIHETCLTIHENFEEYFQEYKDIVDFNYRVPSNKELEEIQQSWYL